MPGKPVAAGTLGNIVDEAAAAAGLAADALERRPALSRKLPRRISRLLQDRRRRLSSTPTATPSSCRAPTTSSTSPATGSRPARWRRCWPAIPTSPNARSSASPITLKGQVPCGFVVLKAGRAREAAELQAECVARVREAIGPVAAFRTVHIVKRLPKTRSRKNPPRHDAPDRRRRDAEGAGDDRRPGDIGGDTAVLDIPLAPCGERVREGASATARRHLHFASTEIPIACVNPPGPAAWRSGWPPAGSPASRPELSLRDIPCARA